MTRTLSIDTCDALLGAIESCEEERAILIGTAAVDRRDMNDAERSRLLVVDGRMRNLLNDFNHHCLL